MRPTLFALMILAVASFCFAGDWSQFRGPHFNGISDETGLPDRLDPTTMLWQTPLPGPGESTPAIVGDRVYLTGSEKENKGLFVMCVNTSDGKVRWKKNVSRYVKPKRGTAVASNSPAADASGAVFLFSNGFLVKFDPEGEQLWEHDLTKLYGPMALLWSYSSSPLLYDGTLYVIVMRMTDLPKGSDYTGSMASYLLGIDPADGKILFKTERLTDAVYESNDAHTTPIVTTVDGQEQLIIYAADHLTGHDLTTGKELWRHHFANEKRRLDRCIATPVTDGQSLYCMYPRGDAAFACSLSTMANGPPDGSPLLWTYEKTVSDVPSPALVDGYLYFIAEKKKTLTCLDAKTGREQWTAQLDKSDVYQASITAADGKLYMVNRKGVVSVVAAADKAFCLLSTHAFDEKPTDSSIAIANGKLYLRTGENLYCFSKKD
jgi:outer membrane protein assembly factor BamB